MKVRLDLELSHFINNSKQHKQLAVIYLEGSNYSS